MTHAEHTPPHGRPHRGGERVLRYLLLGLLAVTWMDLRRCHARRRLARSAAKPEPLQTWEGEGGGLPALGGGNQRPGAPAGEAPVATARSAAL